MEEEAMLVNKWNQRIRSAYWRSLTIIAAVVLTVGFYGNVSAAGIDQKSFKSPEEAVKALADAVKRDDTKELLTIFGSAGKEIIFSGDEVADKRGRTRFVKSYEEMNRLVEETGDGMVLHVGNQDWPFPIPIVKAGENWRFDTQRGKEEILNRRIGRNELSAIQVCLAYVDAQFEYALKKRESGGLPEYAQRFMSEKDKKNGLYWEAEEGEEQSPLGPLIAKAAAEGYTEKKLGGKRNSYHGYHYRILKSQGKNAPGGEYDYMVRGKMIGGFGLVAYPAEYGNSGIMTFMLNHKGVVYQKNLGKDTEKIAMTMKQFDPDKTWKKVE